MIDDLFPDAPFDLEGPNSSFKPYKYRAERVRDFLTVNALPILGLVFGVKALLVFA